MLCIRHLLLGLGLFAAANLAQATPITLAGDHFSVTYDDAQVGLYKQGYVAGSQDTVYFLPTRLAAFSGGSPVTAQAGLQLTLTINPGYTFAGLAFTEWGDYFLSGGGAVDVDASVQVLNPGTQAAGVLALSPASPLSQAGSSTHWELSGLLAPTGLDAQTLLINFDNLLTSAPVNGIGFIQKTYVGFRVLTEPARVPEPASGALLLAGVLAALLVRHGRRLARARS